MSAIMKKYPRTAHLPFSKSVTDDDLTGITDFEFLKPNHKAVITEKMDGENTTMYSHTYHARSMDSRYHPSRSVIAQIHGNISYMIPEYRRIILENVYAEHSIKYNNLPTFAYGIGIVDYLNEDGIGDANGKATFLSWEDTINIFNDLGITPVPVIAIGEFTLNDIKNIFNGQNHTKQEGIVVRSFDSFLEEDFSHNVAKAVRKGHVQTDEHWTKSWKPNTLANN